MDRSNGERPSPGPSKSGSGSCRGATRWRSSHPRASATTSRRPTDELQGDMRRWKIVRRLRRLPGGARAARRSSSPATASATIRVARSTGSSTRSTHERSARGLRPLAGRHRPVGPRRRSGGQDGEHRDHEPHRRRQPRSTSLTARGIQRYRYGEDIGYSTAARWTASIRRAVQPLAESPDHWALMMSSRYNYVGVGLAFRSSTGQTYGSIVFTESRDIEPAEGRADAVGHGTGHDITLDVDAAPTSSLQTHTCGLSTTTRSRPGRPRARGHTVASRATTTSQDGPRDRLGHWLRRPGPGDRPGRQRRVVVRRDA